MSTLQFSKSESCTHKFLILSKGGCFRSAELWSVMATANCLAGDVDVSIHCERVDVTDMVTETNKRTFVEDITTKYGYTPPEDEMIFPIVIYNGRFIGKFKEGNDLFCSLLEANSLPRPISKTHPLHPDNFRKQTRSL